VTPECPRLSAHSNLALHARNAALMKSSFDREQGGKFATLIATSLAHGADELNPVPCVSLQHRELPSRAESIGEPRASIESLFPIPLTNGGPHGLSDTQPACRWPARNAGRTRRRGWSSDRLPRRRDLARGVHLDQRPIHYLVDDPELYSSGTRSRVRVHTTRARLGRGRSA
jgi:hypothetical protein